MLNIGWEYVYMAVSKVQCCTDLICRTNITVTKLEAKCLQGIHSPWQIYQDSLRLQYRLAFFWGS